MLEALEGFADQLEVLLTSPLILLCEIAHYCIVIGGIKQQWDSTKAYAQPVATWVTSMCCCFGGGALVNLLCGKPPLLSLINTQSVFFATSVWWLWFYSPRSFFASIVQWTPISLILIVLKELIRTRKIIKGVTTARSVYPTSILLCTALGMLAACGGGFIKHCSIVLRKSWNNDSIKSFSFSLVTKCCLLFAFLYNLQLDANLPVTLKAVALLQASVLSSVCILAKLNRQIDFFEPIERVVCSTLVDYSAFSSPTPPKPTKSKNPKHRKDE